MKNSKMYINLELCSNTWAQNVVLSKGAALISKREWLAQVVCLVSPTFYNPSSQFGLLWVGPEKQ